MARNRGLLLSWFPVAGLDRCVFFLFAVFVFLILAQEIAVKVAMTGVLDDHWSETFFVFSHKNSLEKR